MPTASQPGVLRVIQDLQESTIDPHLVPGLTGLPSVGHTLPVKLGSTGMGSLVLLQERERRNGDDPIPTIPLSREPTKTMCQPLVQQLL